jgi:hypothetical protein
MCANYSKTPICAYNAANATASVNLIAQTLVNSYRLKKGDSVLI